MEGKIEEDSTLVYNGETLLWRLSAKNREFTGDDTSTSRQDDEVEMRSTLSEEFEQTRRNSLVTTRPEFTCCTWREVTGE